MMRFMSGWMWSSPQAGGLVWEWSQGGSGACVGAELAREAFSDLTVPFAGKLRSHRFSCVLRISTEYSGFQLCAQDFN